ncbi:uncharacterized protein LOC124137499 [Haliotis rufescens]|uniref:uncharacterized protein LOC124137499 n=1 Tax=Haliotis rufescens TaxID=6454 RepID=UPI00201F8265|nr:uncharacterized protein LOC124137499 [Haliotis rufescens]XP_046359789.2 uncharacterized protein LOC124137499 [Haliotis rufescens]
MAPERILLLPIYTLVFTQINSATAACFEKPEVRYALLGEAGIFVVIIVIYFLVKRCKKKKAKRASPKERVAIYRPMPPKLEGTKNGYSAADVEFVNRDRQTNVKQPQHGDGVNEGDYDVLWKWNPKRFKVAETQGVYSHLVMTSGMNECPDPDQYDTTRRVLAERRARPEEDLYNKMAIPNV